MVFKPVVILSSGILKLKKGDPQKKKGFEPEEGLVKVDTWSLVKRKGFERKRGLDYHRKEEIQSYRHKSLV